MIPNELIEDYKSNATIGDLCKKYELSRHVVNRDLTKMGIKRESTWGGNRGGGRKKIERDDSLQRIRERNAELKTERREGVKVRSKFRLW